MPARQILFLILCLVAPLANGATPGSVTFGSVPPRVGDRVDQSVRVELRLKARVRRGAEVLDESDVNNVRAHNRVVTTTEVAGDRRTGVEVVYGESTEKAVAGKTYRCRREGDALRITDPEGAIPPMAEFEVVARQMETLGRPNPLARFLRGKTVAVGEVVAAPASVAAALFGDERFTDTDQFTLELKRVRGESGQRLAEFKAEIVVAAGDGSQTRMELGGSMVIEAASSRLVATELIGPIAMNQSRHDPGGRLQVSATGRFTVTMKSTKRGSLLAEKPGERWRIPF